MDEKGEVCGSNPHFPGELLLAERTSAITETGKHMREPEAFRIAFDKRLGRAFSQPVKELRKAELGIHTLSIRQIGKQKKRVMAPMNQNTTRHSALSTKYVEQFSRFPLTGSEWQAIHGGLKPHQKIAHYCIFRKHAYCMVSVWSDKKRIPLMHDDMATIDVLAAKAFCNHLYFQKLVVMGIERKETGMLLHHHIPSPFQEVFPQRDSSTLLMDIFRPFGKSSCIEQGLIMPFFFG